MPTTTTLRPDLQAILADVNARFAPRKVERTAAVMAANLRDLARAQTRLGRAHLKAISARRRWLRQVSKHNPGVAVFYPLPSPAQVAKTLEFVRGCRERAAKAPAEPRLIEASAAQARAA